MSYPVSVASSFLASLPWYDLPEIRQATDSFWHLLARQLRLAGVANVPEQLNRGISYEKQWSSPQFLFGQACGYDVRIAYSQQLQVIATPSYTAPGCERGTYSSFVIVRDDSRFEHVKDLRQTRCVINSPTSHSGMNVMRALVAPLQTDGHFFSQVSISGSHERSLQMIQQGDVDVAAIDCITYALLRNHRPGDLAGCRVLHHTEPVVAPPFVTSSCTAPDTLAAMREALALTLEHPSLSHTKDTLLLSGVEFLSDDVYSHIDNLESVAIKHNYREIPGLVISTV